jgi:EmrB/QacA subfamily drug resistance transporter
MPSAPRADAADEPLGREVWVVAGVTLVGVVMSILDTTIVNVALETLSTALHAPLSTIQWVATGYLLSLGAVIPLTGWLSERFGAKQVWITAVCGFTLTSALCGLAWSAESLIAFRVLQGLSGGMIMPVGMALMAQTAGPNRIGRVMAVMGVPTLMGPILGPVIGGLIVDNASWRWIFFVNVPIGVLAVTLATRLLDAQAGKADAGKLDWTGFGLLSPGVAAIVFGLSETETHGGIDAPIAFLPILAGLTLIALFCRHALRVERPLIDIRLFKQATLSAASATQFLLGGALFGAMIVLPLYYQVARGESALTAGLLMAPQGAGAAIAMPIAGRITDRFGGGRITVIGLVVMIIGTVPLVTVGPDTSYGFLAAILVVRGLGFGSAMMPSMAAAFSTLSPAAVPRATSALNVIQRVGGTIGTALLAVVLQHELATKLGGGASSGGGGGAQRLPEPVRERVADPLASAFASTFWWAVASCVAAMVPALLLARAEARSRTRAAQPAEQHVAA